MDVRGMFHCLGLVMLQRAPPHPFFGLMLSDVGELRMASCGRGG